jgi:hypothetical protein
MGGNYADGGTGIDKENLWIEKLSHFEVILVSIFAISYYSIK